jgi:hypothetical protein
MSEKRTSQSADMEQTQQPANAAPQAARRRLLKGSVAIPVIMTLHSGAALARTSNLVSKAETDIAVDANGDYVCAIPESEAVDGKYDLGIAPYYEPISPVEQDSQVNTLVANDKDYMPNRTLDMPNRTLEEVAEFCETEHGGILISQSAYNSISGRLRGEVL